MKDFYLRSHTGKMPLVISNRSLTDKDFTGEVKEKDMEIISAN
ncbi:MAG: hypothetical protein R3A12_14450 [Ignavibacteria bacterium]